jgi:cell division protein FtsB
MSSVEDFKGLYIVVKKATDTLEENRQQLVQEKRELEALRASTLDAVRQLSKLPVQITDTVTSAVRSATAQVAPAVARDLKGHLSHELEVPLASAKTHIANAAKIEQQLMGALNGFDKQVYWKLSAGVAVVALGGLLVMFLALYWQRSSLTDLMNQKAQLQAEMPQLQATVDYLKKHGGGITYTTCIDGNAKHFCVLVKTDRYWGNATSGFYAVPVGD